MYTRQTCSDTDLNELFKVISVPKLNENEKNSINEELKYDEILAALKEIKNNKNTGLSDFTTEFYKFFWIDIDKSFIRS